MSHSQESKLMKSEQLDLIGINQGRKRLVNLSWRTAQGWVSNLSRLQRLGLGVVILLLTFLVIYIDFPHLVWALESLVSGRLVNQVKVKDWLTKYTKVAFEQVLTQP